MTDKYGWHRVIDIPLPVKGTFFVWMKELDKVHGTHIGLALWHPNVKYINGRFAFDISVITHWQPMFESPEDVEEENHGR